ncbi:MAG: helix-turn-helix transcriptional regulator, partial [Actinobacteria bacterium]|nr:helix-turn-helix transcriptional regulator [Actinomycetota bacterium]
MTEIEMTAAAAYGHKAVPVSGIGDRLRSLRLAAGLTQSDLAGERCSKEYVSQIERGKTRPTAETVAWLAERLGVDPQFLARGVSTDERSQVEAALARAYVLSEEHRYEESLVELDAIGAAVRASGADELEVRWLLARERAHTELGDVRHGIKLLQVARTIAEGPAFSDVERAEILLRLGIGRYKLSSI